MRAALLTLGLLGCTGDLEPLPDPGPLQAGLARARMTIPLGIGTVGFGPVGVAGNPTPYADIFPGTKRIHGHPSFEAIALSRGEDYELVFLRTDLAAVYQQLRTAVVDELRTRTGRDFDDVLVMGATHTHSGPGRMIPLTGPYELATDRFLPEHYHRIVGQMADVVEASLADLRPARLGFAVAHPEGAQSDRRCEDGLDHVNDALPIVAVERDGQVDAVLMSFAIHGTVFGIDEYTLSQDVSGGIEEAVADAFDHPVQAVLFNAWAGDVAPGNPTVEEGVGAEQPDGFDRIRRVGVVVAEAVTEALATATWDDAPELHLETRRFPISREAIGYPEGTFPYPYGALYCGSTIEADCDASTTIDDLDHRCIELAEEYVAPLQTQVSVGRVGDFHLVTFPGEPGTVLAEQIIDEVTALPGVEQVMFLGYTQDYLGYSILEEDWWQGGYEASGAIWGPQQGEYLLSNVVRVFGEMQAGDPLRRAFDLPAPRITDLPTAPLVAPATAVSPGTVLTDVAASYTQTDIVVLTVAGSDPWWGAPTAFLETAAGEPVTRAGGIPVDSDGYLFWVTLDTDPTYRADLDAASRTFLWTFHLPAGNKVPGAPVLDGDYRLRVVVPLADGTTTEVSSGTFTVTE